MTNIWIENGIFRVGVSPDYGARVISLFDKRCGREWLTQGGASPNTGEEAAYGGDEAVGWDECFPTVGAWDGTRTVWRRRLRDHGDLWGRPWEILAARADTLATQFETDQFRFARTLTLDGPRLRASYSVANRLTEPLPYLWALHSLFAVEPGDRIELGGVEDVHASFMAQDGRLLGGGAVRWVGPNEQVRFRLDEVQPPSSLFAGKFLVPGIPGGHARLGQPGQWLEIQWDDKIDSLGIWLTYGAWPEPGGHQEAAVEPTNAPANDLGEAIVSGAAPLAPGERREWQVTLMASG